jgi:hypothetical protein
MAQDCDNSLNQTRNKIASCRLSCGSDLTGLLRKCEEQL